MNIIELKNVSFEYASYEEQERLEDLEREKKRQEKLDKKNKKGGISSGDVFAGFEVPKEVENEKEKPFNRCALSDLSLEIKEGEFVGLVGHNGSGKSTLAKLFNGLLLPTKGNIMVCGLNTKEKSNLFEIRKNVGMVFQNPDNQMIASIVEDDIAFGPENIGIPPHEIEERVTFALESVGMEDHRHSTPFKLSGGQKQRIAIAGMLALKPKVLVLDEATAMLDPKGRREVMEVARKLNKDEGMTVVNISHYMDEVVFCDRVIVLDKGKKVFEDTPQNVFSHREELKSIGLNIPPIMEIARLIKENGISEMPQNVYTMKELVDSICQLSQKN